MNSKAYTQVNYIINEMSEEMRNKIPYQIRKNIENRMDKNYEFYIEDDDFENAELLEDTEKILSVLYTDYLSTDEEKIIIKNKERILKQRKMEELMRPVTMEHLSPEANQKVKILESEEKGKEESKEQTKILDKLGKLSKKLFKK